MSTRIESAARHVVPLDGLTVQRCPWAHGEGYLVTTPYNRRFLRSWAATLDYFVQAMQPRVVDAPNPFDNAASDYDPRKRAGN